MKSPQISVIKRRNQNSSMQFKAVSKQINKFLKDNKPTIDFLIQVAILLIPEVIRFFF